MKLPAPILEAIDAFSDLPGIGNRSAERLIFSLLKNNSNLDQKIAKNLGNLKSSIKECEKCFNYSEFEICPICADATRDAKVLCVVKSPLDAIALERSHEFHGLYHILHGVISPLNKVSPEEIRAGELFSRVKNDFFDEIILALSGNIEAEATANFLSENLRDRGFNGKITILARGIPSGGELDFLDSGTVGRAICERREI